MLSDSGEIKLIDFGLAKKRNNTTGQLKTIAGTPMYMAPEILNEVPYDSKVDMWSLGVLLYVFMSGYMPFNASKRYDIYYNIQKGKYHFKHEEFDQCSDDVKNLIMKLLQVDPSLRLSANEALNHSWFKTEGG